VKAALTILAILAFLGVLWWSSRGEAELSCEVCIGAGGRTTCATVRAPDRDAAIRQGVATACGIATGRMDEELACQRTAPSSVTCDG
jgi:hypothetical protein